MCDMILGIYGAGGLGREVFELSLRINSIKKRWSQVVFIDDASLVLNKRNIPIYRFIDLKKKFTKNELEICIAVGEPKLRSILYKKVASTEFQIATLIDPNVSIPDSTKIGCGTIICKYVSIT